MFDSHQIYPTGISYMHKTLEERCSQAQWNKSGRRKPSRFRTILAYFYIGVLEAFAPAYLNVQGLVCRMNSVNVLGCAFTKIKVNGSTMNARTKLEKGTKP
jgi:hypothetical protein